MRTSAFVANHVLLTCLLFGSNPIVAHAAENGANNHIQKIWISVAGGPGPSFDEELENTKKILDRIHHKVIDIQITGNNGFGEPLAGNVLHLPTQLPQSLNEVSYEDLELLPNCIWGDIYEKVLQRIKYGEYAGKSFYFFDITSRNNYGKPCSARLGSF